MGIEISKSLKKKLPDKQRNDVEAVLWKKSGGVCFLCEHKMNQGSDTIVADHDVPEAEGGATELSNLNLVHTECNSFKRNHRSVSVRPFLALSRFIRAQGRRVNYADCLEHFGIDPKPSQVVVGETAVVHLPGVDPVDLPICEVRAGKETFSYTFVEVPRDAIYNDDDCQPRTINEDHLWGLYLDLATNPLHEPPGCRLSAPAPNDMYHLVMFDGQHKTLASWLNGHEKIVVKLYLDIDAEQTIELVNSVQARIKKLPLSPFELAAKMAQEWQNRVTKYEKQVGTSAASEAGFLRWVDKDERRRAKAAFEDALIQNIIDRDDISYVKYVALPGTKKSGFEVTESAFRNKVLKQLLHMKALEEDFLTSQGLRNGEADRIVRLLNLLVAKVFEPDSGSRSLTEHEKLRAKRLTYQSALHYVSGLLRETIGWILVADPGREFLDKEPTPEKWAEIEAAVDRLLEHPVWTSEYESSPRMQAIQDTLSKNQNAADAFRDVQLRRGYVLGADELDASQL
jgi:hypothetical protein